MAISYVFLRRKTNPENESHRKTYRVIEKCETCCSNSKKEEASFFFEEMKERGKKNMRSPSSIILWFVRGLWPIISVRVEQYGAAVTVPVSVAVVRYQHLPRKAARSAYACTCTHPYTRANGRKQRRSQHNLRQLRIQSFTLIASTPSNICSRRKGDRVTFIKMDVLSPREWTTLFPHGNSLLNRSAIGFHGVR